MIFRAGAKVKLRASRILFLGASKKFFRAIVMGQFEKRLNVM
jgi:hypothetical protein